MQTRGCCNCTVPLQPPAHHCLLLLRPMRVHCSSEHHGCPCPARLPRCFYDTPSPPPLGAPRRAPTTPSGRLRPSRPPSSSPAARRPLSARPPAVTAPRSHAPTCTRTARPPPRCVPFLIPRSPPLCRVLYRIQPLADPSRPTAGLATERPVCARFLHC